jgi:hypothetical protein
MADIVPAAEFARNFGCYQMQAQRKAVPVWRRCFASNVWIQRIALKLNALSPQFSCCTNVDAESADRR